jgi:hypothetical protein
MFGGIVQMGLHDILSMVIALQATEDPNLKTLITAMQSGHLVIKTQEQFESLRTAYKTIEQLPSDKDFHVEMKFFEHSLEGSQAQAKPAKISKLPANLDELFNDEDKAYLKKMLEKPNSGDTKPN